MPYTLRQLFEALSKFKGTREELEPYKGVFGLHMGRLEKFTQKTEEVRGAVDSWDFPILEEWDEEPDTSSHLPGETYDEYLETNHELLIASNRQVTITDYSALLWDVETPSVALDHEREKQFLGFLLHVLDTVKKLSAYPYKNQKEIFGEVRRPKSYSCSQYDVDIALRVLGCLGLLSMSASKEIDNSQEWFVPHERYSTVRNILNKRDKIQRLYSKENTLTATVFLMQYLRDDE